MEFCTGLFFFLKEQLLGKYDSTVSKESTWNDIKHTELNYLSSGLKHVKTLMVCGSGIISVCFTFHSLFLRVI